MDSKYHQFIKTKNSVYNSTNIKNNNEENYVYHHNPINLKDTRVNLPKRSNNNTNTNTNTNINNVCKVSLDNMDKFKLENNNSKSYIKSLKNTTLSMKKEIQKPESNKVVENVENFKNKDNKANDNGNDDFDMDFLNNSGIMDDLFNNDNDKDIGNGNGNGININTNNNQYQSNNNTFNNTCHNNNKSLLDKSFDSNLNNSNSYNNQQNTKKNNNNLYKNNSDLEVQSSKINNKTKNQVRIVL